ncbi:MAG: response regulator [Gemmatimonadales bacterium]|jgi:CheY-like chemotaxis protein
MARVLVVDDQPEVRRLMLRLLERAGHTTAEADGGAEGLRQLAAQPADLVVTDLFMPGMDGLEFMRELSLRHPGMRVIAVSGGGFMDAASILAVATALGAVRTLSKPFDQSEFLALVGEVLAA